MHWAVSSPSLLFVPDPSPLLASSLWQVCLTFSTSPSLYSPVRPISSCPVCLTRQVAAQPPAQSAPVSGQPIAQAPPPPAEALTCGAMAHMSAVSLTSRRPCRSPTSPVNPHRFRASLPALFPHSLREKWRRLDPTSSTTLPRSRRLLSRSTSIPPHRSNKDHPAKRQHLQPSLAAASGFAALLPLRR